MNKDVLAKCVELRRELHAHPELSGEEVWTKARLMDFLQTNTKLELRDRGRYFYAVYHTEKPEGEKRPGVAIRADFDALPMSDGIAAPWCSKVPGVAHKCGHDGHAAALCALGCAVEELRPDRDVYLVFQFGEETGIGAIEAKDAICENAADISETYAWHNTSGIEKHGIYVVYGVSNCASMGLEIAMTGSPTHASAPEAGKNPGYALAKLALDSRKMAASPTYQGLVMATLIQLAVGEEAYGIAAHEGVLRLTIRGENEAEMQDLKEKLEAAAREMAEAEGLSVRFHYTDVFPETRNDDAHVEKVCEAAWKLGLPLTVSHTAGRGSEDYGYFLKEKPGALFYVSAGVEAPGPHTQSFDFDDDLIETAVAMMCELIGM